MHELWRRELPTLPFPTHGAVVMPKHSLACGGFRAYCLYLVLVNIIGPPPASAHGEQTMAEHCPARVKDQSFGNVQGS